MVSNRDREVASMAGKAKAEKAKKAEKAEKTTVKAITIHKPKKEFVDVEIVGKSRLVVHAFPQKTKHMILRGQQGEKTGRVKRNPKTDYQACFYNLKPGKKGKRYGFPVCAFKKAIIMAGSRFFNTKGTELSGMFFIQGEPEIGTSAPMDCVEIRGTPRMREDVIRLNGRTADLRYRPEFPEWSTTLRIEFNPDRISLESIVNLIDEAGNSVGIGEWRVEKKGDWGRFEVKLSKKAKK